MLIKGKELLIPLIQGGMGVGVSLSRLAGNVAKCDCMGVISAADIGFKEDNFWQNPKAADLQALKSEIEKARIIAAGHGLIAINAMVAGEDYDEIITTAVENKVDCIISGAGLPSELPGLVGDSQTAIAPIVSSAKAASVICKLWDRHYKRIPDFIVVEGPMAGGHLGFNAELIQNGKTQTLEEILPEVLNAIKPYSDKYNQPIPVFAAGGIYTHGDVKKFMELGAAGVQVATRFIATYECDASDAFKNIYLNIKKEDIEIIKSPVGMPGRAVKTPLITRVAQGEKIFPKKCVHCLKPCDPAKSPYCITAALIDAVNGNYSDGLHFCGSNAYRLDKIVHVRELIDELMTNAGEKI